MIKSVISAAAAMAIMACAQMAEPSADSGPTGDALRGAEWASKAFPEAFIRFEEDGRVTGSGGCNNFFGSYAVGTAGALQIGPLASTKKACMGGVMDSEMAFFAALERAAAFEREGNDLILRTGDGEALITFYRSDWD